jgi:hypothetical protein
MASEQVTSVLSVPLDALLCWKLIEDAKKGSRLLSRKDVTEADRKVLRQRLVDDVRLVESTFHLRQKTAECLKEGVKTAAHFLRGKGGLWSAVGLYVLDECKLADTPHAQACDAALGAAKGAAMQAIFRHGGHVDPCMRLVPTAVNLPLRASAIGAAARITSAGLTRSTWLDTTGTRMDAGNGVQNVVSAALNPVALCVDVATFGASAGLTKGLNKLTDGAMSSSPLLATVAIGGGVGFSTGAAQEAIRQRQAGEHVDLARIAGCGLVQGAFDAAGAVPGGKQAEREALRIYNSLNISPEPARSVPAWRMGKPSGAGVLAESESSATTGRSDDCFFACGQAPVRMIEPRDESAHRQRLDIALPPELPTAAKLSRLTSSSLRMEFIERARDAGKGNGRCLAAGPGQTVTTQREPVRVYAISGHDCELMIPEEYARKLEPVRRQRIRIDDGGEPTPARQLGSEMDLEHLLRALPEDIVPVVDGLPNSKLIGRINVFGHRYPYDQPGQVTLGTARDRKINLYRPGNDSEMRSTTNHEWAHLLHQQRPNLLNRYRAAVDVEDGLSATSYNARKYARTNERENWAVHLGEEMLDPAAARMLEFGRYAPLRISVLGRALKVSITEGPQAETSLFRKQFEARANFIEERFVPLGLKSLLRDMRRTSEPSAAQLEALGYLGNESHIKYLKQFACRAETDECARHIVNCGLELLRGRPYKQFKFLWDLAEQEYSEPGYAASRAALSSFTAEQIDQFYKPALQKLERVLGARNPLVAKRCLDLADWCRLKARPAEGEPLAHKTLSTYEEIYGVHHGKTGSAALVLADCLWLQGKHGESLPYWVQSMEAKAAEFGQYHKSVFRHLLQIQQIYDLLGRIDDQEACLRRILAYYEHTHGSDPAEADWVWDKLSGIYARRQDYERAQEYERRADAVRQAAGRSYS